TVAQRQQPLLVEVWQRRALDIEAQMHRTGDLVDVLPAGALRANRIQLDLAVGQAHGVGDFQHYGPSLQRDGQRHSGVASDRQQADSYGTLRAAAILMVPMLRVEPSRDAARPCRSKGAISTRWPPTAACVIPRY